MWLLLFLLKVVATDTRRWKDLLKVLLDLISNGQEDLTRARDSIPFPGYHVVQEVLLLCVAFIG